MDLQTIKSHYGAKWAWARTGALILFVVTGILLVASLSTARSQQPSRAFAGPSIIELNPFPRPAEPTAATTLHSPPKKV